MKTNLRKYNTNIAKSLILTNIILPEELEKELESFYEAYIIEVPEVEVRKTDIANHIKNLNHLMYRIENQMIQSYENNEGIRSNLFRLFIKTYAYLEHFSCKEIYLTSLSTDMSSDRLRKELFEKLFEFSTCPPEESVLREYVKRMKGIS
jgi:hypothetical protein